MEEKDSEEKKGNKKEKTLFDTRFFMWIFIIFLSSSFIGMVINEYVILDEDVLFWVCSTIFQGLLSLLALWGAFIIFQIQSINSQIMQKQSMLLTEYVAYVDTEGERLKKDIEALKIFKARIKKFLIKPVEIIAFTVTISVILILFNNISFKVGIETQGMIPSFIVFIISLSIWSIQLTVYALRQLIFVKE